MTITTLTLIVSALYAGVHALHGDDEPRKLSTSSPRSI